MSLFLLWIVVCLMICWFEGILLRGKNQWSFVLWLPFTVLMVIGTLGCLGCFLCILSTLGERMSSWGLTALIIGVPLLICPLFLAISIATKPLPKDITPWSTRAGGSLILAVLVVCFIGYLCIEREWLAIEVVEANGTPIPGATIRYTAFSSWPGFGGTEQQIVNGDALGTVKIPIHRCQGLRLTVGKIWFDDLSVNLSPAGSNFRVASISWESSRGGAAIDIPNRRHMKMRLFMAHTALGEALPYPQQASLRSFTPASPSPPAPSR